MSHQLCRCITARMERRSTHTNAFLSARAVESALNLAEMMVQPSQPLSSSGTDPTDHLLHFAALCIPTESGRKVCTTTLHQYLCYCSNQELPQLLLTSSVNVCGGASAASAMQGVSRVERGPDRGFKGWKVSAERSHSLDCALAGYDASA